MKTNYRRLGSVPRTYDVWAWVGDVKARERITIPPNEDTQPRLHEAMRRVRAKVKAWTKT